MKCTYHFNQDKFCINNYNLATTFSSFLPGISGKLGIPLWAFYVNRGQAITSFGVGNKHNPILEFYPADQAYRNVSSIGFRTFLKLDGTIYEPFKLDSELEHRMEISYEKLKIWETNKELGIKITISYTTLAENDFPALIRQVEIENLSEDISEIEIIDGLPRISPFGVDMFSTKMMSYTSQAWMEVQNLENKLPFFKVKAGMEDSQSVESVNAGNFYLSLDTDGKLQPFVDPKTIFGSNTGFTSPSQFSKIPMDKLIEQEQITFNQIPCAMFGRKFALKSKEKYELYGIIGQVHSLNYLNSEIPNMTLNYLENQFHVNKTLIDEIGSSVAVSTSNLIFDNYAKFCYLDNVLRGGKPMVIETADKSLPVVYHTYFRKHGDLERDYNDFYLAPEYYSQGNGNYRDINQNRRMDVWINPKISYYNILTFMNLIQADGYNPLVLTGNSFVYEKNKEELILHLRNHINSNVMTHVDRVFDFVKSEFTPGSFLTFLRDLNIDFDQPEKLVNKILAQSEQIQNTNHGEGYWVDHFGYNLDLIENYLSIFPEKEFELLFISNEFSFHDSDHVINPLSKRMVLEKSVIVQRNSVYVDEEKVGIISQRSKAPNHVRLGDPISGQIYKTNLFVKLLSLILVKFSTLDPRGFGLEMEAGKPGWYDALNGLPGLFGSSATETFVLKKYVNFLQEATKKYYNKMDTLSLPQEIKQLGDEISQNLETKQQNIYWAKSVISRETYRESIKSGFINEETIEFSEIADLLQKIDDRLNQSIEEMIDHSNGNLPTYFYYVVENSEEFLVNNQLEISSEEYQHIRFHTKSFPLFLEGFVKGINLMQDKQKLLLSRVLNSGLYDNTLKMFKVNENLASLSFKIGRAHSFVRGWLENESIWMHMQYKFLLELLKSEMYDVFYTHLEDIFIPFLNPGMYGRSTLENSSFIVSSAFPEQGLHGRGFYARLSGVTVEAMHIIFMMFMGRYPYKVVNDKLILAPKPSIPSWLFTKDNSVTFRLHGKTEITYLNPTKRHTHDLSIDKITIDGKNISENKIIEPHSKLIRNGRAEKITIVLKE